MVSSQIIALGLNAVDALLQPLFLEMVHFPVLSNASKQDFLFLMKLKYIRLYDL